PAGALVTNKWFDTTQRLPTPADYSQFYTFSNGTTQQLIAALSKHAGLVLATSPSPRQFTGKIYILTSQRTASTCEPLTYALQQRGHATVIGSHTAGAMLSAAAYYLPFGFMVSLPVADYYTYDGLRLEGHGVQPDIECPPQQALERCLLLID
ncbi:MAG TPA: S41 family peptidase, partial [Phnomibacter sp.]|nr:S41 family peptidase [Phnomibacter sp.]